MTDNGAPASVPSEIAALEGNTTLYAQAQADHASLLDGFPLKPGEGVEYQEVVGSGEDTVTNVDFDDAIPVGPGPDGLPEYIEGLAVGQGNGDSTVPITSASQGTPTPPAPYHTQSVCGTLHRNLPNDKAIQNAYRGYLTRGATPQALSEPCPVDGATTYIIGHRFGSKPALRAARRGARASATLAVTLQEAVEEGRANVIETEHEAIVVTNASEPVTLEVAGEDLRLVYEPDEDGTTGKEITYGPVTGDVTVSAGAGGAPAVAAEGKILSPTYEGAIEPPTSGESHETQSSGPTQHSRRNRPKPVAARQPKAPSRGRLVTGCRHLRYRSSCCGPTCSPRAQEVGTRLRVL